MSNRSTCYLVVFLMALAGCASGVNPVSGRTERDTSSEQEEIQQGAAYHQEILKEYPVLNNPALQQYVSTLGKKLASHSHRANLPWTFTVLDSPEVNAFATAGGYVYITRGIMAHLESEAELSGVLAHEIGHITARHVPRHTRDQKWASFGQLLAMGVGAYLGGEQGAQLGAQLGGAVAQQGFLLPRSRDHELQADKLGAEYLQRIQYDPRSMAEVIGALKLQETFASDQARAAGKAVAPRSNWFATHPSNEQRLDELKKTAAQYAGQYQDPGRDRYLRAIDGIVYGDSREQGLARGEFFYHEPLGFVMKRPSTWRFQNTPEQLLAISDDEQVAVILQAVPGANGDHNRIIREVLKADSGRPERITLNGFPATYFFGTSQGKEVEATIVSIKNADFVFAPIAKSAQAKQRHRTAALSVIESLRPFTSSDARAATPYTIRAVPMPRTAPGQGFRELARTSALGAANPEAQLRLINQAYPSGEIEPGRLVKIIQ